MTVQITYIVRKDGKFILMYKTSDGSFFVENKGFLKSITQDEAIEYFENTKQTSTNVSITKEGLEENRGDRRYNGSY